MKATYKLTDPDSVEATLTVTMTLGNWKKIRQQLYHAKAALAYPNFKVREAIDDMIGKAENVFETEGAIE
jgi:hypothetical protein